MAQHPFDFFDQCFDISGFEQETGLAFFDGFGDTADGCADDGSLECVGFPGGEPTGLVAFGGDDECVCSGDDAVQGFAVEKPDQLDVGEIVFGDEGFAVFLGGAAADYFELRIGKVCHCADEREYAFFWDEAPDVYEIIVSVVLRDIGVWNVGFEIDVVWEVDEFFGGNWTAFEMIEDKFRWA